MCRAKSWRPLWRSGAYLSILVLAAEVTGGVGARAAGVVCERAVGGGGAGRSAACSAWRLARRPARELGRAVDAGNVEPELGGGPRVVIKQPKVDPEAFPVGGCRSCQAVELSCDHVAKIRISD